MSSKAYGPAPCKGTSVPAPSLGGQGQRVGRRYLMLDTTVRLDILGSPPNFCQATEKTGQKCPHHSSSVPKGR